MNTNTNTIAARPVSSIRVDNRKPFTATVHARYLFDNAPTTVSLVVRSNGKHFSRFPTRLILRNVTVESIHDDGTATVQATVPALLNSKGRYVIERSGLLAIG
jgi:hypothetical protein